MVVAAWVMPIAFDTERTARVEAFCFGLLVLTVLFVPRYGTVTVNANERLLMFRESIAASCLHPWRRREQRELALPEGCTVLIGWWLGPNGFATGGVKRIVLSGDAAVLFENGFGLDGPIAARLASALKSVASIHVRTVKPGGGMLEMVDWTPIDVPAGRHTISLFFLSWAGFPLAILRASTTAIVVAGIACFVVYAMVRYAVLRTNRTEVERFSTTVLFGFGLSQFALMYTVMAVLGRAMG